MTSSLFLRIRHNFEGWHITNGLNSSQVECLSCYVGHFIWRQYRLEGCVGFRGHTRCVLKVPGLASQYIYFGSEVQATWFIPRRSLPWVLCTFPSSSAMLGWTPARLFPGCSSVPSSRPSWSRPHSQNVSPWWPIWAWGREKVARSQVRWEGGLLHHRDPLPGQKLSDTRVLWAGALSLWLQSRVGIPHLLLHVAHWAFLPVAHLPHVEIFVDNLPDLAYLSPAHLRSLEQTADDRFATSACHARHWHHSWTLKALHSCPRTWGHLPRLYAPP